MKSLAIALDQEFKRVAQTEDVSMGDLVAEVADLLGCTERMLYNYRSGKWPIPSSYIAALCKRFKSTLLFDVIAAALNDATDTLTLNDADIDATKIRKHAKELIVFAMQHFELIEAVLEQSLSKNDVLEVEKSSQQAALKFQYTLSLIDALYERQNALKRKQA